MEYFASFLVSYASYRLRVIIYIYLIHYIVFISANLLFLGLLFIFILVFFRFQLYFHLYNAKKLYAFAWFCLVFFSEYFAKRNSLVRALNFSLFEVLNIIYIYIYIYI